jgi:Zn-dependent metalloprotease
MKKTLLLTLAILFHAAATFAQNAIQSEVNAFAAKTGASATISRATNAVSFVKFPALKAMKLTGGVPSDKALNFVKQNAGLFKAKWNKEAYLVKESKKDNHGMEHVALQQNVEGVPVYDGVLKFHFNRGSDLTSMNGNFVSVGKLNTTPSISRKEAEEAAVKYVTGQKLARFSSPLKVSKSTLYVFQKGLAQGFQGPVHLVYEVEVTNDADVREFLYIDAHTKELVEQFTGMHSIDRKLYEVSINSGNLKWQETNGTTGAPFNTLDVWQQSEVMASGHIYNLMKNAFGYNSYDNAGATMITINNNPDISCPNASWNGRAASFCTGTASDDVVAHEWAHAYTEHTSGLIYAWQTGALNESYSDIWGETVDQLNNYMDADESNALRTGCNSSARWKIGEKATSFAGALRDMWDPTCYGSPGKVSDPQYWCSTADNGGVHMNSGVLNHAYALLVDGGSYNGQIIKGIGLTKAAHIFWRAQSNYMTSTTDFAAQADILEAALADLIGINLPGLSTAAVSPGLSGEVITADDAIQLSKVIAAVELRSANSCNFPALLRSLPVICSGSSEENAIFYENFESGFAGWTVSQSGSASTWTSRDWVIKAGAPDRRPGHVAYAVDFEGGDCITNLQNGVISLTSPVINIPSVTSGPFFMAFDHYLATEVNYDGGNIKYRIDGGAWALVPASAFTGNGYNRTLASGGNPMQGEAVFSGTDEGSVGGSWGQSRIDLSSLGLTSGQNIQFRWDFGTDACTGLDGWYIDDIRVYSCATPSVEFVTTSTLVNEGEAQMAGPAPNECLKYIEKTVTVRINKAPSQPVTITLQPPTGTAVEGLTADYSISPVTFVLQAGHLQEDIKVRIYNDAYAEETETFTLTYTLASPDGGDAYREAGNQSHTFTIKDDDLIPNAVETVLVSEDFETGMPSGWTVVGGGTYPSAWSVVLLSSVSLDAAKPRLLFINSDASGVGLIDKVVESAPFNTVGMTNINLSFQEYFYVWPSSFAEQGIVDVWDGSAWRNIFVQNQETGTSGSWISPASRKISIPAAYANAAMKIRFRYIANYDFWWGIDNVKVVADSPKQIQSAVTVSPAEEYFGPHATAHFFDPVSGSLIAKIANLSNHDYGCTTVHIDRAGIDETTRGGNDKVTKKTFKVTPAYNNPSGSYEITLYYKADELPHFNGTKIRSMVKSPGNIMASAAGSVSYSEVQVSPVLTYDYAYKATFHNGFSGFGLSDVPPSGGPLPVNLITFEGQNSNEGNLLNWRTTLEINNAYFAVEKTVNGRDFEEIGRVAGVENPAVSNRYQYLDTAPSKGVNYYRLRQADHNGRQTYSKIIAITAHRARELKFFPNPVQSVFTMEVPDPEMKFVHLKVINSLGQEVLAKQNAKPSLGRVSLDLEKLPAGIYQVIMSDQNTSYSVSVMKL